MTDYIIGHELGHVLQFNFCDERNQENIFRKYLELRNSPKGICKVRTGWDEEKKESIYENIEDFLYLKGTHEQKQQFIDWDLNPREWFAEDFRYLFGTDQGDKFWGLPINPPDEKIREFMLSI